MQGLATVYNLNGRYTDAEPLWHPLPDGGLGSESVGGEQECCVMCSQDFLNRCSFSAQVLGTGKHGAGCCSVILRAMKNATDRSAAAKKAAAKRKQTAAANKAAATRKANAAARKRSQSAVKAAATRKANAAATKRSQAAKKANETRKRNAAVKAVPSTPENVTPVETTPEAAPKVSE